MVINLEILLLKTNRTHFLLVVRLGRFWDQGKLVTETQAGEREESKVRKREKGELWLRDYIFNPPRWEKHHPVAQWFGCVSQGTHTHYLTEVSGKGREGCNRDR